MTALKGKYNQYSRVDQIKLTVERKKLVEPINTQGLFLLL